MERSEQRRLVEALVLATSDPITPAVITQVAPSISAAEVGKLVEELNAEYREQDRAFEIWEVAGGLQMRTLAEFSGYLQQLRKERPLRLSRAALETLSVVAYRQPATRQEIETVRGVDVGAVLKSLMERHLVRISGHREVPGRPLLYSTTKRFLEVFGLDSLKSLPTLRELEDLLRERGQASGEDDGDETVEEIASIVMPDGDEIQDDDDDDDFEDSNEEGLDGEAHADEDLDPDGELEADSDPEFDAPDAIASEEDLDPDEER